MLQRLKSDVCELIPVEGPVSDSRHVILMNNDDYVLSNEGPYATRLSDFRAFIEDLDASVLDIVASMTEDEMNSMMRDCGRVICSLSSGIAENFAQRDAANDIDTSELLSVLPHQLERTCGRDVSVQINFQRKRLLRWKTEKTDLID